MRSLPSFWRALAGGLVVTAAVGCSSSGEPDVVPVTTDPNAPKIERVGKDGPGEGAAARTPEAEPLSVD